MWSFRMRLFQIIMISILLSATSVFAQDAKIKKSDLLKGVKEYATTLGTVESCFAWATSGIGNTTYLTPKLAASVEETLFDYDLSSDDIAYFQKTYSDVYMAKIEESLPYHDLTQGSICEQLTNEVTANVQVNSAQKLIDLIKKYKR